MNIILFSPDEVQLPLPRSDERARHILTVLRRKAGDSCDVGLINGPRGRAVLQQVTTDHLLLSFAWGELPAPLAPIQLVVGLPRPQTARDLLREGAALGVAGLSFAATDRGEASYADSSLWRTDEWKKLLVAGAAQAFCTQLPQVESGLPLRDIVERLPADALRIALDNYEASAGLAELPVGRPPAVTLAVGGERGWSAAERELLREKGFVLAHLGSRVLRTETACIAGITLLKAKLGWL